MNNTESYQGKKGYIDYIRDQSIKSENLPEGKQGYIKYAENAPELKEDSWSNTLKEYGKTILKGTAEGVGKLGRAFGPSDLNPHALEEQTANLNKLLPTEDESFGQKALRRGLNEAPTAMATGGASLLSSGARALAAGVLGQGAEELGAPEWVQTAAELTAYLGPDITKKLLSAGKDKDIIDAARKFGLTDEQITPLIQSDFKQKWFSKLTPRRGETEKALVNTYEGLGTAYNGLAKGERAALEIAEKDNGKLINGLFEKLNEIPREIRGKIEADLDDLLNNKITGRSLINFWKDINSKHSADKAHLGTLKEPIKEALKSVSPQLEKDFEMVNKLYSRYYPIAKKLKPNIGTDIVGAAEALGIMGSGIGIVFGHYPSIAAIVGEQGARHFAKNMLINPRFQQLGKKMVVALNENKYTIAKKVIEEMRDLISKYDPEASKKLQGLSKEEFEQLLKYQQD